MKKHIYIYSPSGAVRDKAAFKRGVALLSAMGHEVEIDLDALSSVQRFAGSDESRINGVHRAAASGADIALMSRGGYGLTRILAGIHYKSVHKAIERGTVFVGHSDFTALQMALLAKTASITWAGPHVCGDFGVASVPSGAVRSEPDEIMLDCFNDLVLRQGEGTGWRQNLNAVQSDADEHHIKNAMLWGGNLTVLTSLLGTPYFPAVKGGVLFLEDVGEHPYRVERMLTQLLHCGVLKTQKAVILGQFTDFKLTPHDRGFKLQSVVDRLRSQLKIPVVTNLPFGHVSTKVMLPVGAKVDLVLQGRDALILWGDEI
ncbi:MAG: LD-carboxypeptidase [Burkholderiales bacterium PBB3]|nr:MAG: LD-carboxypeptidase [Burkholderiales bacterium PBB3]